MKWTKSGLYQFSEKKLQSCEYKSKAKVKRVSLVLDLSTSKEADVF